MEKRKNSPQKGAAKKWSERLKELGEQPPPKDLMEILNQTKKPKKGAGRKWADRLEELGRQSPPKGLLDKINMDDKKKIASPRRSPKDRLRP
jgi:hypothetical protein